MLHQVATKIKQLPMWGLNVATPALSQNHHFRKSSISGSIAYCIWIVPSNLFSKWDAHDEPASQWTCISPSVVTKHCKFKLDEWVFLKPFWGIPKSSTLKYSPLIEINQPFWSILEVPKLAEENPHIAPASELIKPRINGTTQQSCQWPPEPLPVG